MEGDHGRLAGIVDHAWPTQQRATPISAVSRACVCTHIRVYTRATTTYITLARFPLVFVILIIIELLCALIPYSHV